MTTRTTTQPALSQKQFELVAKALADPRRMALLEAIGSEREFACSGFANCSPFPRGPFPTI